MSIKKTPSLPKVIPSEFSSLDQEKLLLLSKIREREELMDSISSQGLLPFLNQIVIDSSPDPRPFREIANSWQWALVRKFSGALENIAGLPQVSPYVGPRNFWFTLPRGHDKTGLIGRSAAWLLAYSRRNVNITTAAKDKEQAGLIIESMSREASLNPWVGKRLKFFNYTVENLSTGSYLEALASDAGSSMGGKPHLLIFDELTWWSKQDLWDSLASSMIKREGSVQMVITNAGLLRSWQHQQLERAKRNPGLWYVYEAPGALADWMSEERIEQESQKLLPSMARRVFRNEWIDPSEGTGYVSHDEVVECEKLGQRLFLSPKTKGLPDRRYFVGVDYGPSRDRTVVVILHEEPAREDSPKRVLIDNMWTLQGSKTAHVPIARIEELLEQILIDFPVSKIVLDRYQLESVLQKFQRKCDIEAFEWRGSKSNYELAQALRNAIVNTEIAWYPGTGSLVDKKGKYSDLTSEFRDITVKYNSGGGYRIENIAGRHDDRIFATGMTLLTLLKTEKKFDLNFGEMWF